MTCGGRAAPPSATVVLRRAGEPARPRPGGRAEFGFRRRRGGPTDGRRGRGGGGSLGTDGGPPRTLLRTGPGRGHSGRPARTRSRRAPRSCHPRCSSPSAAGNAGSPYRSRPRRTDLGGGRGRGPVRTGGVRPTAGWGAGGVRGSTGRRESVPGGWRLGAGGDTEGPGAYPAVRTGTPTGARPAVREAVGGHAAIRKAAVREAPRPVRGGTGSGGAGGWGGCSGAR